MWLDLSESLSVKQVGTKVVQPGLSAAVDRAVASATALFTQFETKDGNAAMNLSFLSPRGRMLLSLAIFGTIGLVRRFIPLVRASGVPAGGPGMPDSPGADADRAYPLPLGQTEGAGPQTPAQRPAAGPGLGVLL